MKDVPSSSTPESVTCVSAGDTRLALEAPAVLLRIRLAALEQLDGDLLPRGHRRRDPDLPHAALAEQLHELVFSRDDAAALGFLHSYLGRITCM
jgi:hypothetical protein